jgi:hypothetical protein
MPFAISPELLINEASIFLLLSPALTTKAKHKIVER